MKLLKVTEFYSSYLQDFYTNRPGLADLPFAEQKATLDHDAFGWADYWSHALSPLGYDVLELTYNAEEMQRAWAKENSLSNSSEIDLESIVIAQARTFKPDILWFDDDNEKLLARIRSEIPSIKLVLGWVGSAIPQSAIWKDIDLILSCAPESVSYFNNQGLPAAQIHHGFDPRINDRLIQRNRAIDFSFFGQLLCIDDYHLQRYRMIEKLAAHIPIRIFSPSANLDWSWRDEIQAIAQATLFDIIRILKPLVVFNKLIRCVPLFRGPYYCSSRPVSPMNMKMKPFFRPAVYGLAMFQALLDSKITLNVHADSSPHFASNMRLFETTGVGTCMIVDWKQNLHELFEDNKEIVTYTSAEECLEKVTWLLDHPKEREEIARAGQLRTLKEHTFNRRALQLDKIIQTKLSDP